jgi:protein-S-isoprenylcysteine O-methyltransferase Ste14
MKTIEIIVFLVLSLPIVYLSRKVLFNLKSHGFYRFLSWECILFLLTVNFMHWFDDPLSVRQVVSWIFLMYSLYLVLAGVLFMKKLGQPREERYDKTLFPFEKTTNLVEKGIYKYIRHPMFSSLLFLNWGALLKNPHPVYIIIAVLCSVFLFLGMVTEEKENIEYFGEEYRRYMKKTRMIVPFLI